MKRPKFKRTYTAGDAKVTLTSSVNQNYLNMSLNGVCTGHVEILSTIGKFMTSGYIFDTVDQIGKWLASNYAKKDPHRNWMPSGNMVVITLETLDEDKRIINREIEKIKEANGKVIDVFQSGMVTGDYAVIRVEVKGDPEKWLQKFEKIKDPMGVF